MSFQDLGKKADEISNAAKQEAGKVGREFQKSSNTMKYIIYGLVGLLVVSLGCCTIKGCRTKQPVNQPQAQTSAPQMSDAQIQAEIDREQYQADLRQRQSMSRSEAALFGVLTGVAIGTLISDGHGGYVKYNGNNGFNDPRYHGPKRQVIINKTYIINKYPPAQINPVNKVSATPVPAKTPPVETKTQMSVADRKAALMKARNVNQNSNFKKLGQDKPATPPVNKYLAKHQAKMEKKAKSKRNEK